MYFVPASLSCAANRAVSFLLIQVLILSSVMGLMIDSSYASGIVVDRNAPIQHRAGVVESKGNGSGVKVPVVNITRPSGGGTSRNAFTEYNVGSEGVILNNSAVGVNSVSGGRVRGNRNLSAGKEASVIVNEVTGGNPSKLAGMTEVVGKEAAVVVANPNGVTCDGCSFYNTPQVRLSTGTVQVDNEGNLVGLGVERGTVSVGAGGLRASTATDVELIGRKVIVDGAVRVNPQGKLGVRAGRQQYNTVTGESRGAAADASRVVPAVAIDATAVGAMQAGQIHIMSTESGAGVRLDGDMAANAGDITIDANGNIVMGRADTPRASVTARKDIKITSTGSVEKHSHSYSYEDTKVTASGDFTNTGRLDGQDDVAIDVKGAYTNTGKLDAGKDMALTVGGAMVNSGYVDVGRDLRIRGAGDVTNDTVRITVGNQADIQLAGSLLNQDSDMFAFGGMDVRAANMVHRGVAYLGTQGALSVNVVRDLLNLDEGSLIQSGGDMSLVAGGLIDNRNGSIISLSNLSITAGSLNNDSGIISAEGNSLSIAVANGLTNRFGLINSNGTLSITTGALDNSDGAITSAGGSAIASRGDIINERGLIHSNSTLNISAADKLNNREGVINAHGAAAIQTANSIDNSLGLIQSNDTLAIMAGGDLVNALGQIGAVNDVSLTIAGQLDNFIGEVASDSGSLLLNLGGISDNRGGILASAKDFTLNANGDLDISQGMLSSKDGILTLTTTGKLTAQGSVLTSGSDMALAAQGDANLTGLELRSGGAAAIAADDMLLSNALILADDALQLTAQGNMTGGTSYLSATDIVAQAGGGISQAGSIWYAPDAINIMAQSGALNLSGGQVVSEDIGLTSGGLLTLNDAVLGAEATSQGLLQVAKRITADAGSVEANRLVALVGEDGLSINSQGNTTAQDALIVSSGDVSINSGGLLDLARSEVTSVESLTLNATGTITTDHAQLAGNNGVEITSTNGNWSNLGNDGMIQSGTGTVSIAANAMDTQGSILSPEGVSLKTQTGDMLLGGLIYSTKDMVLESGLRLQNRGGQIQVGQGLQMRANGDVVNSAGGILAVQNGISLQLAQGGFINDNASIITPGLINLLVSSLSNANGTIQSGNGLTIATTNGINNSNGTIASYGASSATISASNGAITNTNGTIASASSLNLTGSQGITNTGGTIQANTTLTLSATNGGVTNQGGSIQASGDVSSNASWHDNSQSGKILSGGSINLTSTGNESLATNLSNGNGGLIQAVGNITAISNGRIGNQGGTYQAGGLLTLQAQGRIDNSSNGMLVSGSNMNITSQDYITNNVNGLMLSGGDMTIRTGLSGIDSSQTFAFNNHQGTVQSGGLLNLTTRNLDNYLGTMQSDDTLTILADNQDRNGVGIRNDGGLIQSGWDMSITTDYSIGNINGGEIRALRDATIQVELDLNNSYLNNPGGLIEAGNNLSISNTGAGHVYNENGGRLEAGNLLSIVLAKEHRNPAYDAWIIASAQCTADPDCDPTTLGAKPQEFIRGKIYNTAGELNATILFTQVNAIINDNRSAPNGTNLSAHQTAPNANNSPNNVNGAVSNILTRSTSSAVAAAQGAINKQDANPGANTTTTANNVGILTSTTRYQESQRVGDGYQYTDQYRPSTTNTASNTAPQARATPPSDISQLAAYNAEQRKLNQISSIQNYAEAMLDPTKLSGTISAQMWTGSAGNIYNNGGTINVDFMDISANNVFNNAVVTADGRTIKGTISGDTIMIAANGTLSNIGGKISGTTMLLNAKDIQNERIMLADGTYTGGVIKGDDVSVNATNRLVNQGGMIQGKNSLYVSGKTIENRNIADASGKTLSRGELSGKDVALVADGGAITNYGGKIDATGDLYMQASDIRNYNIRGELTTGNKPATTGMMLRANQQPANVTTTTKDAINELGTIHAGGTATILADNSFVNRGDVSSGSDMLIHAKVVDNQPATGEKTKTQTAGNATSTDRYLAQFGYLPAQTKMQEVSTSQDLVLGGGNITSGGNLTIIGDDVVKNRGKIKSEGQTVVMGKVIDNAAIITEKRQEQGSQQMGRFMFAQDDVVTHEVAAGTGIIKGAVTYVEGTELVKNAGKLVGTESLAVKGKVIENIGVQTTEHTFLNGKGGRVAPQQVIQTGTGQMVGGAGGVMLVADELIHHKAGTIVSGGDVTELAGVTVNADGSLNYSGKGQIIHDVVKNTGTNTGGYHPISFAGSTILAGGKITLAAGDSISIRGSELAGNGDVSLLAQNSITVEAVADKYVSRNKKSTFKKSYQETGVIQSSGITSGYGDVSMQTQTGDITVLGSAVNAGLLGDTGGVIHLKAGHDVITDMTHVETKTKKSGFGGMGIGIGYSSTQSNGHEVALTGFNGDRVVLEAEHDVRVTATQFNTTSGDVILHGKNQTIVDAGLLDYYLKKGSTGISFSASAGGFLGAAGLNTNSLTGDNDFIGQSPILSSLRTLNNSKGDVGTAMSLVNVGAQLSMFNGGAGLGAGLFGGPSVGITLGTNKSTTKWQQLYPSMFNVAGEVIIKGDHGAQVLGGAVIDAKQGITLDSGVGRLIVEAGATQSSSKNSSASIGVSYGAGGLTFSAGASKGQSKGTSYSPVQLITDGTLTIRSQNGADFLGVVTDVNKVDVGVIGDVNVVTLQNQFHSKSSGFGVSFTYGPGMATGSGISASSSKTDRVFTDNQTSIIGKESTVWNVSGNTNLVGSVVAQGTYDDQGVFHDGGNMQFNSGSVSYTHLNDKDISKSISGGINIGERPVNEAPQDKETSGSGTLSIDFSTTKGLTLATLGNGNITLGAGNIDGINRDVNGSQIITEHDVQRGTITLTPEMLTDPVGTVRKIGNNLDGMSKKFLDIPSEVINEGIRAVQTVDKIVDKLALAALTPEERQALTQAVLEKNESKIKELSAKFKGRGLSVEDEALIDDYIRKTVTGEGADGAGKELLAGLSDEAKAKVLWQVGVFFDGTWKDERQDTDESKSNVVALRDAYSKGGGDDLVYKEGVGTKGFWDSYLCGATGCGADDRMNEAMTGILDSYNEQGEDRILIIDSAGFSRGAATAREFTNRLLTDGVQGVDTSSVLYVRSLALFDTVSSFGYPDNFTDVGYNMQTSPRIGIVIQATAQDEHRRAFDLQSIGYSDGTYPPNAIEQSFPGAHSDIGGTYETGEQGKIRGLSFIPLQWVHDTAVNAGVPYGPIAPNYLPDNALQNSYNNYKATGDKSYLSNYIHDERTFIDYGNVRSINYPNGSGN